MKRQFFRLFLLTSLLVASMQVFSQDPPPPPNGGHGQGGNQTPGGSAPIGNGIALLLVMATAYSGKKIWDNRNKMDE